VTENEKAANAVAILLGHTCATCQYRTPMVERWPDQPTRLGRRWLACSLGRSARLTAGYSNEVEPLHSCVCWQKFKLAQPGNCRVGPPFMEEAP
jgi:hypothetical protein